MGELAGSFRTWDGDWVVMLGNAIGVLICQTACFDVGTEQDRGVLCECHSRSCPWLSGVSHALKGGGPLKHKGGRECDLA
jgi:hypothetical protein